MNESMKRFLHFLVDHSDILVEIMHWDEAEFSALIASMVDTWSQLHKEDAVRLSKDIADMIEDKHKKEEAE